MAAAGHRLARTSGTGHAGTISVTARGAPRPQNAMKPRFQRALTHSKPGFMASGTRASTHDHHKLRGIGSGPRQWDIVVVVPGLGRVAGGSCGMDAAAEVPVAIRRCGAQARRAPAAWPSPEKSHTHGTRHDGASLPQEPGEAGVT